jgi:hypothetical protein
MAVLIILNLPFCDLLIQAFYELFNLSNCGLDILSVHFRTYSPGSIKKS